METITVPERFKTESPLACILALGLTIMTAASLHAATPASYETGFENATAGGIELWQDNGMRWSARRGDAAIHTAHQRSGKQSLRIHGGEDKAVDLAIDLDQYPGQLTLSFWAERWTSRAPFRFRIQANIAGAWKDIYVGDQAIRVGGFDTHVKVALPRGVERYRLVSTSPEQSGIMIDDLRISPAVPMRVESLEVSQPISPALIGNRSNPIALISIKTQGQLTPKTAKQIRINTSGTTDLSDIEWVEVYYTGANRELSNNVPDANFPEQSRFGKQMRPADVITFEGEQQLLEGDNYFWISYKLKESANIDGQLDAGCEWVRLADTDAPIVAETVNPEGKQRLGVALRTANDDGARVYRIPGLATTNKGTLIGVYDIRYHGGGDLPGHIDVGMSRSTDGGRTWQPMQIIMDMGSDPAYRYDGIGDPAVLVDQKTNTIFVAALWSHGNRGWHGSGPGLTPDETGQFMIVKSEDDGKTWSDPINITNQIKHPDWNLLLQGPGKGITMADGTLVFPAQYQDTKAKNRLPYSTIIFSKDQGQTWQIGTGAYPDTTEAQVVELEDGRLMLNCRYNRQSRRVVMITDDLGATWQEHPSSRNALTEPRSCMASLINVDRELGRPYSGLLLFSNPAHPSSRREMTIRASRDGGRTWPVNSTLQIDHGISAGYSCMTMIDEKTVGILYEGNRAHMTFQRIPLTELIRLDEE